MHAAVRDGNVDRVSQMCHTRVALDEPNEFGETPMHWACEYKQHACLEVLLAHGADVESRDCLGRTPFHYAALAEDLGSMKRLYAHGANASHIDDDGQTVLFRVCMTIDRFDIAEWCLCVDIPIHQQDKLGWTVLHHVCRHGRAEWASWLIQRGAALEAVTWTNSTPLHTAVAYGRPECIHTLLECGAAVRARDEYGKTPLHLAAQCVFPDIAERMVWQLLQHGASSVARDVYRRRPIDDALEYGNKTCIQLLCRVTSPL